MNVDLETVKKQYILCKQLTQSMGSTSNKIMKTYISAGAAWHDEHYKKLGSILQECSESLLKTILHISDTLQGLESVINALQEYDNINFSGGGDQGGNTSTQAGSRNIISSPGNFVANVMSAGAEWCNSLSEVERSAVSAYTGQNYRNINAALRGQSNFEAGNLERAQAIHSALSRASIPQDCVVYRGVNPNALGCVYTRQVI